MKKSLIFILHLGFWLCYSIIVLLFSIPLMGYQTNHDPTFDFTFTIIGVFYLPQILTFYFFYLVLFPKYLLKKKLLQLCIYSLLTCAISALIGVLTSNLIRPDSIAIQFASIMLIPALMAGIVGLVIRGFITWYDELQLKQELTAKNHKMEMALVKAQLDPHFLFNTLNNIDVLIEKTPKEASKYLNRLSDILRFMLFETKVEKISLTKEIEYLEKYISLQKIRSSNKNFVRLTIDGEVEDKTIAPMVLMPFVENAFKHVGDKKAVNAIDIQLVIEKNAIQFKCQNNTIKKTNNPLTFNGLGNELISKRLDLLYPKQHALEIENTEKQYKIELTLHYGQN
jgi:two-component system, LytTR family, sensor kinase